MADMDYNRQGANLFGIAMVAAGVGAIVGLLMAPKPGSETREDLRNKYYDVKGKAQSTMYDAKDRLHHGIDAARNKANHAADKANDKLDSAETTAASLADHVEAEHSRRRKTS